jgi:hypothetical protein
MIAAMKGRAKAIRFIGPKAWGRVLGPQWRELAVVFHLDIQ